MVTRNLCIYSIKNFFLYRIVGYYNNAWLLQIFLAFPPFQTLFFLVFVACCGIVDNIFMFKGGLMMILWCLLRCFKDGRCADADDILPDGHKLKQGDGVYYISYAMGRMSYIWGEDAKEFRPERWLNNGVFQPESPFKFVAFHVRNIFNHGMFHNNFILHF